MVCQLLKTDILAEVLTKKEATAVDCLWDIDCWLGSSQNSKSYYLRTSAPAFCSN